jgi:hypothetical protein
LAWIFISDDTRNLAFQTQRIAKATVVFLGPSRPQLFLQLISADDFARTLQQHDKNLHRLALQPDLDALFVEFFGPQIKLEGAEAGDRRG